MFQEGSTPADMGWGVPKITCYAYIGRRGSDTTFELDYGLITSEYSNTINNGQTVVTDSYDLNDFRSVEWLISVTDGTNHTYYTSKILAWRRLDKSICLAYCLDVDI